jgi:hypothetical protein
MSRFPSEKRGLLDIIRDGFLLLRENYLKIVLPLFLFSMIPLLLNVLLTTGLEAMMINLEPQLTAVYDKILASEDFSDITNSDLSIIMQYTLVALAILVLENMVLYTFEMCGIALVAYHLYKKFTGQEADLTDDMKKAFNYKLMIVLLILGPFMSVGLFIVFGFFIYLIFTYNMPEYEGLEFIKKNWKIGSFFKKILIFLIPLIGIHFLFNFVFGGLIDLIWNINYETYTIWVTTGNYGMLILYQAVSGIGRALLFAPLAVCLLTSLFTEDFREYKVESETQQFYMGTKEIKTGESLQLEDGMYCPFCGIRISGNQNFCPKCGESLEFIA